MSITVAVIITLAIVGFALFVCSSLGCIKFDFNNKLTLTGEYRVVGDTYWDDLAKFAITHDAKLADFKANDKIKLRVLVSKDNAYIGAMVYWPNRVFAYADAGLCEQFDS